VKRRWRRLEERLETIASVLFVAYLIAIAISFALLVFK